MKGSSRLLFLLRVSYSSISTQILSGNRGYYVRTVSVTPPPNAFFLRSVICTFASLASFSFSFLFLTVSRYSKTKNGSRIRRPSCCPDRRSGRDERRRALLQAIDGETAVGVAMYPLTCVKTLFQLGYEPYPITQGKRLLVLGRECYFLPNGFAYARYLYNDVGVKGLFSGVQAGAMANLTGGFAAHYVTKYLNEHFPNIGGKPENVDKEHRQLDDNESLRLAFRVATRETIARFAGVVLSRPFTVLMTRSIAQLIGQELKYNCMFAGILKIGREEGPAGLFSGLIPQLIAEAITIWGIHTCTYVIERCLKYANFDDHDENDVEAAQHAAQTRKMLHFVVPFMVNCYAYPFQVVSTVMATVGSGLAVSMLPYAPSFSVWQDAWHFLKPHGLKRGARLFLREQSGAISVGSDNRLYASYKHFA
ncbi:hypothetical protein L596_022028 [Steinernema carpocapsae]|uniref:Mitochondrial carrier protein n=1 Tax=Steinernema carpocapsae TaxID=34508 RepID=A0A4V6A035_STECR|nr:hypothetical protein L596_022028 [Steinernema carpocapsae]